METISIIIPCYNEEEAIPVYYETCLLYTSDAADE